MTLNEGIDYWFGINGKAFDMAKARDAFKRATEFGSAEAYYWLGDVRRYDQDAGRWPEVLAFYQKAVDKGSSYGYYGLGTLYETGYGVDKDVQKAIDACGPFDDSDNPEERLHKPLPYARYALEHYGQPLERS